MKSDKSKHGRATPKTTRTALSHAGQRKLEQRFGNFTLGNLWALVDDAAKRNAGVTLELSPATVRGLARQFALVARTVNGMTRLLRPILS